MIGRQVGFSYSQYITKDWTMGLEAKFQIPDRDLSYAVSAKYDVGSNLIGTFFLFLFFYAQEERSQTSVYWRRTI